MKAAASKSKRIEIELIRSSIACLPRQRATLKALGLGKVNSKNTLTASPQIMGMLRVVNHLLKVKELN